MTRSEFSVGVGLGLLVLLINIVLALLVNRTHEKTQLVYGLQVLNRGAALGIEARLNAMRSDNLTVREQVTSNAVAMDSLLAGMARLEGAIGRNPR